MIVAPWKFDVLKTNICPRSEASRENLLVSRTSNFQGATIRPENSKKLWKQSLAAGVPTAFSVLPNFHSCFYNSIETPG